MGFEFAGMRWHPVLCKICRAGAKRRTAHRDFPGDQAGIVKMADANGKIDTAVHEIHPARTQGKTKVHLGVTIEEFRQNWRDIRDRKICLGRHVQAAGWRVRKPAHGQPRLV